MTWQEIRLQYPDGWVLVEAIDAFTEDGHRVIQTLHLVNVFAADWQQAWEQYKTCHHADKNREYYILHTQREEMDIGILDAFGRVVS